MVVRALAVTVAALALWLLPAGTAGAVTWGIADQRAAVFDDARLRALAIDDARLTVPWDVGLPGAPAFERDRLDRWLEQVTALGIRPLVTFEQPDWSCPGFVCLPPTPAQAGAALTAFRERWPAVTRFGSWNEPNHPSQPFREDPAAAAAIFDAQDAACPACTLTSAELVDSGNFRDYLAAYAGAIRRAPDVWALHNYGDLQGTAPRELRWLLDHVEGPVWLTETGGIVRLVNDAGEVTLPEDEQRAATAMRRLVALSEAFPRLGRIYVYQWQAGADDRFDAGLVRPDGTARPALAVLRAAVGTRPAPGAPADPAASPGAPARPQLARGARGRGLAVLGMRRRAGAVLVRIGCRRGRPCRGAVAVHVRNRGRTVLAGRRRTRQPGHSRRWVRVGVRRPARRVYRRARRVTATVTVRAPRATARRTLFGPLRP